MSAALPIPAAIVLERARQLQIEGWTPEHDDQHTESELHRHAMCYAARWRYGWDPEAGPGQMMKVVDGVEVPGGWVWDASAWKPKDALHDLKRAGALLLAEIARRERAGLPWGATQEVLLQVVEYGRLRGVW